MKQLLILLAITGYLSQSAGAQPLKTPAPSTPQYVKQDFGLSNIELSYSRPNVKGRKIFGDLVPFGKVWRTGANQATTLTFGDPVTIGGTTIPAGKYGLLSIPDAGEWTIIITHQTDVTNAAAYKPDQDIVRIKVTPVGPESPERYQELADAVDAHCPVLDLFSHETPVERTIAVPA